MTNLKHLTRCALCPPETAWQIDAQGFDPINILQPDSRVEKFVMALEQHIQEAAIKEQKYVQRQSKRLMESGAEPIELQKLMFEHGKHLALFQSLMVNTKLGRAFSTLSGFDSLDPEIRTAKEGVRMILHAMTARRIPDDAIREGIAQLGLTGKDADLTFELIRKLLDASNGVQAVEAQPLVTLA